MKKILLSLFYATFFFYGYSQESSNSDSKKKANFIIGLSGAPNNTYNIYAFGESNGGGSKFEDQKISFGGEAELYVGFKTKKNQVTLGLGYGYNRSKNMYEFNGVKNGPRATNTYNFYNESYKITLNANWLVGDKNRWIVGANTELSILNSYKGSVHIENNPANNQTDFIYEYYTPQYIGWIGINFGRLFQINDFMDLSVVFNTKASSLVLGKDPSYLYLNLPNEPAKTNDRNLLVKTLNFSLTFKL